VIANIIFGSLIVAYYVGGWMVLKAYEPLPPDREWLSFIIWTVLYGAVMYSPLKTMWDLARHGEHQGYMTT
jgi:hypothetical protein